MPRKKPVKQSKAKPLDKAPPVPTGLKGKYAVAYWKRISAELVKVDAITELHLEALEALCRQWQSYRTHSDWCDTNPSKLIFESGKNGHLAEHPRVRLRQQAYDNLTKLWPKFGLTPEGLGKLDRSTKGSQSSTVGTAANPVEQFAARKGRKK